MNDLLRLAADTPLIDTHCHLIHPDIHALAGSPPTPGPPTLASLLLCLSNRPTFVSSGMPSSLIDEIVSGRLSRWDAKAEILRRLPLVENTSAVRATVNGIFRLAGLPEGRVTAQNYDALERTLAAPGYAAWTRAADRYNIRRMLLNMWAGHGAAYFCEYADRLSAGDAEADRRLFYHIATVDAHALDPFSETARKYAGHLSCSLDTLTDYERFLERLLEFLVRERHIRGLKVSEQYFRRLNYRKADARRAADIYGAGQNQAEHRELLDYIAYLIFGLAQRYNLTVQFHTGMLWGSPDTSNLHPADLCEAAAHFPRLRFDLMHMGFPHLGEIAAMAANAPNIYLNLAWVPLISERIAREWLVRLLDMVPLNKLTVGTDVFDIESLCGAAAMIRGIVAGAASSFPDRAGLIIRRILYINAAELYGLEDGG